jgi:type I restriction enzyme S subunit
MSISQLPLAQVVSINPPPEIDCRRREVAFVAQGSITPDEPDIHAMVKHDIDASARFGFFRSGDLLMPNHLGRLAAGEVAQVSTPLPHGYYSTHLLTLRADARQLDSRFLLHFLRRRQMAAMVNEWLAQHGSRLGNAVPFLRQLILPLPPVAGQREVVTQLDCAWARCAQMRSNLQALDQQRRLLFREYFGATAELRKKWLALPLGELLEACHTGKKHTLHAPGALPTMQGPRMMLPAHLGSNRFCAIGFQHLQSALVPPASLQIRTDDVLFDTASNSGRSAVATSAMLPACIGPGVTLLRLKQGETPVLPGFLAGYLASASALGEFEKQNAGKPMAAITHANLAQLPIYLPPLPLQAAFLAACTADLPEIDQAERDWLQSRDSFNTLAQQTFGI